MKKLTTLLIAALCLGNVAVAQNSTDTIFVKDYGIAANSYQNSTLQLQKALKACKEKKAKVLSLEQGRYDIWPENSVRREYFITNTSSEQECPSKVKTIGVMLDSISDLTIDGNGATLMFHGIMTTMALDHCSNVTIKNLHIDFERPAGSEIKFTEVADGKVTVAMHRDTRYNIVNGKVKLIGEGWISRKNHCIEYNPTEDSFRYTNSWNVLSNSPAEELSAGVVRFSTPSDFRPTVGNTMTIRDIIRSQVGVLIYQSSDVTLKDVGVHYMHGLGIVSQYSKNITMDHIDCAPREGSGRVLASSADFLHFSGCSGKVTVLNSKFSGAQDDGINVHGTNLRIIEKLGGRKVKLRFMHPQTYGFQAYFPGDDVAFVKAETMERLVAAKVVSVERVSDREWIVGLDTDVPNWVKLNADCLENISCTPEVEIRGNYFTHTSTRGTLMTTPRKVVIEDNTYFKTGMSAILIEGDAEGWYESGPVNDVLIRNNKFIECAYNGGPRSAVIAVNPSNRSVDPNHPVHRNIRIENNMFVTFGNPVLFAKSTQGLTFTGNKVERTGTSFAYPEVPAFQFVGCKDVKIKKNELDLNGQAMFSTENMKKLK